MKMQTAETQATKWRVVETQASGNPTGEEKALKNRIPTEESVPFFPHHFLSEMALALAFLGFILVLAGIFEPELGPPANPVLTPAHILPEWYFLWIFGLLRLVSQTLSLLIPILMVIGLFLLPWLDRKRGSTANPIVIVTTVVLFVGMIALSIVGYLPW